MARDVKCLAALARRVSLEAASFAPDFTSPATGLFHHQYGDGNGIGDLHESAVCFGWTCAASARAGLPIYHRIFQAVPITLTNITTDR